MLVHYMYTDVLLHVLLYMLYVQYMFVTEVDSTRKKAVHDELARLLVQYIRQQGAQQIALLLDVSVIVWWVVLGTVQMYYPCLAP